MRRFKTATIIALLTISAGALGSHNSGSLWPWIPASVGVAALVVLVSILWRTNQTLPSVGPSLALVIGIAVFYRTYMFVFPASMIGMDPDGYAVWINQLVAAGSVEAMNVEFYAKAPFFPLLNGLSASITGLPVRTAMIVTPILTGILIPLSVYLLSRYITHEKATEVGIAASLIATVAAQGFHYSYWPISQMLATLFLCLFAVVSIRSISGSPRHHRFSLLFMIFLISLAFTHKLPLLVTTMFVGTFVVLVLIPRTTIKQMKVERRGRYNVWMLFGITLLMMFIQWTYIADFLNTIAIKLFALLGSESSGVSIPQLHSTAAVNPYSEIGGLLLRNAHAFVLLVLGAVAWLVLAYTSWRRRSVQVLHAVTAGLFLLYPITILVPNEFRYTRVTLFIEPFLAVLIAVAFVHQLNQSRELLSRAWTVMGVGILIFVVVTQIVTPIAAPDYPGTPRLYLTSDEVAAKEFGHQHVDNSKTGPYYAGEQPFPAKHVTHSGILDRERGNRYTALNSALYNATLLGDCPSHILYRQIDVYRFQEDKLRLTWDPQPTLDTHYNRIYTNSGAEHYSAVSNRCKATNFTV